MLGPCSSHSEEENQGSRAPPAGGSKDSCPTGLVPNKQPWSLEQETGPRGLGLEGRAPPSAHRGPAKGARGRAPTVGSRALNEQAHNDHKNHLDGPPLLKRPAVKGQEPEQGANQSTTSLRSTTPTQNFHLARQVVFNP